MEKEKYVARVYEMLYPYGTYSGDIPVSCVAIKRELKTLCKEANRYPLLIIAKYLGMSYDQDTPTLQICQDISDYISDICLNFHEDISSKVVIGYKTGFIDPSNMDVENMYHIYNVMGYDSMNQYLGLDISTKNQFDQWYLNPDNLTRLARRYTEDYMETNTDYEPEYSDYYDELIERHLETINKVLRLMYENKIPFDATYEDISNRLNNLK